MKFKNKIIISFCIIIFVPIFLATLVLFSMQHIQMRAIEQTYGVEGDGYSYFSNSVQLLSRFTREIYREVYKVADNQPEKLEDGAYLEKINQQLEEKASYLIVRKGQELVYIGKSAGTSLLTELPEYGSADGNADSGTYMDGEEQALVKQIDFVYPDGAKGSVFKKSSDRYYGFHCADPCSDSMYADGMDLYKPDQSNQKIAGCRTEYQGGQS